MTILKTRKEIIETKKVIGSEVTKIQKASYNKDMLQYYREENKEHLYWEKFDFFDREVIECETYNKIIGLNHSDINSFTTELTKKLTELFQKIEVNEFYIISHLKTDFFGNRDNKFKPLVRSYKKLEAIVGQSTYKEAFECDINSLSDFIEILFWTTRCDPCVAEYIFLFDKNENIQMNLCKYGNIHLTEFGNEILTDNALISLGWTIIDGQEFDNFTESGKIEGRKLKMPNA
jgi:hypothetical protein